MTLLHDRIIGSTVGPSAFSGLTIDADICDRPDESVWWINSRYRLTGFVDDTGPVWLLVDATADVLLGRFKFADDAVRSLTVGADL